MKAAAMSRKRFKAEKIIEVMLKPEVAVAQGKKLGDPCCGLGMSEQAER
jgi:hypothetical protein